MRGAGWGCGWVLGGGGSEARQPPGCPSAARRPLTSRPLPPPFPPALSSPQFDRSLAGEPARPKDRRTTKRLPTALPAAVEKSRNASILKSVLGGSMGEGERAAAGGVKVRPAPAPAPPQGRKQGGHKKHGHGGGGKRK